VSLDAKSGDFKSSGLKPKAKYLWLIYWGIEVKKICLSFAKISKQIILKI
jgi:hypothetical protein